MVFLIRELLFTLKLIIESCILQCSQMWISFVDLKKAVASLHFRCQCHRWEI